MRMYDIIARKRDGKELSYQELNYFISNYCSGMIPDYQASALLMAIFFRGMNDRETADLTELMANSGDRVNLSEIKGFKVDKHSTGGVGDKTTLIVAPIVASCGIPVAKMSGKGLGHTGGTIDKLESITGFKTSLTMKDFISNIRHIGISIASQTGNLAPADKKLYALRDVTATINSIPLIASSIMSKKIASGADGIVLDVKTGSGAFMKSLEDSIELARIMVGIGKRVGKKTAALITDMDVPLGNAIGNSLEVIETIETLKGNGPEDVEKLSLEIAARMIELAGMGDIEFCRKRVKAAVKDGSALKKFAELINRQGGDAGIIQNYEDIIKAPIEYKVFSENEGYVESIRADSLGTVSMILGAGRETIDSSIDYSAGIYLHKKTGSKVKKGDLLGKFYTRREDKLEEAEKIFKDSYGFSKEQPDEKPLILSYID